MLYAEVLDLFTFYIPKHNNTCILTNKFFNPLCTGINKNNFLPKHLIDHPKKIK